MVTKNKKNLSIKSEQSLVSEEFFSQVQNRLGSERMEKYNLTQENTTMEKVLEVYAQIEKDEK